MALYQVTDYQGVPHLVSFQGQDQILDFSGSLGAGAVGPAAAFQQVAPANPSRAGWLFQNASGTPMLLCEIAQNGGDQPAVASSFQVAPGAFFPPYPGYPIPTGAIFVIGSGQSAVNDSFVYREFQNAQNE